MTILVIFIILMIVIGLMLPGEDDNSSRGVDTENLSGSHNNKESDSVKNKDLERERKEMGLSDDTPDELLAASKAMRSGDTETAMDMLRYNEDPSYYYFDKAKDSFIWNDDYEKAIEYCNKGIDEGESNYLPTLYSIRGESKSELGKLDEAVRDLSKAIDLSVNNHDIAKFLEKRSEIYDKMGDHKSSKEDIHRANMLKNDND